jgi:hypothetical protein
MAREMDPSGARALALSAFCIEDIRFASEAIAALQETDGSDYQAELLGEIGGSIPLGFVEKALLVIKEEGTDDDFASLVESVASRLSSEARASTLNMARGIDDRGTMARVLAAIALASNDRTELLTETAKAPDCMQ